MDEQDYTREELTEFWDAFLEKESNDPNALSAAYAMGNDWST